MLTLTDFKTADDPEAYRDEYFLTVTFRRYMSDDYDIALCNAAEKRTTPADSTVAAVLRAEFLAEIQEAYDCGHMTGFLDAGEVKLSPK